MGSLSGMTSVLSPLLTLSGVPGTIVGIGAQYAAQQMARDALRMEQDTALAQLKARQSLDEKASAEDAAAQKAKIAADAQDNETRRRAALRRAVARQKTLFSAQGLSSADAGSNEAVLLGLYNDSEAERESAKKLDTLRISALDQNLEQQRQKNLLESTILADRQKLTRLLTNY